MTKNSEQPSHSSSLSIVGNQGLTATLSISSSSSANTATAARTVMGIPPPSTSAAMMNDNNNFPAGKNSSSAKNSKGSSSLHHQDLDFIGTGDAVKSLLSIPYHSSNDQGLYLAIHNVEGTLLIDQTDLNLRDANAGSSSNHNYNNGDREAEQKKAEQPVPVERPKEDKEEKQHQQQQLIDPSSQHDWTDRLLALALSPTAINNDEAGPRNADKVASASQQSEALSLLSNMKIQPKNSHVTTTVEGEPSSLPNDIAGPVLKPVREYLEWNFQDMKLLVGSNALVIRPESSSAAEVNNKTNKSTTAIAFRVENVHRLNQLVQTETILPQGRRQQQGATNRKETLSYAQAVTKKVPPKKEVTKSSNNDAESERSSASKTNAALNFDHLPLQTCIVPSSEPLGALLESSSSSSTIPTTRPLESPTDPGISPRQSTSQAEDSSLCVVLDAYLDNVMANVPQLALCLEEKGVIQSVKLLPTERIPSMMLHPSTLDTSKPFDMPNAPVNNEVDELFSPKVMELNANALLRFLKQNCTRNNATYMLCREPGDSPNKIQLYDMSVISQRQKHKWNWWLATMSYRFALRLRQCQTSMPHNPPQQRAFRDRQRSLYQTTLDLLQDLLDMDGNAHESLVASVREHMADTFLGEEALQETNHPEDLKSPQPVMASSPPTQDDSKYFLKPPSQGRRNSSIIEPSSQRNHMQQQWEYDGTQHQPYAKVTVDSLNKAHDHLVHGIKTLWPVFESNTNEPSAATSPSSSRRRKRVRKTGGNTTKTSNELPPTATAMQLFGLNYKVVNVSLRLAEHHLRNYYSSSAMQALRNAARRMADSSTLLNYMETNNHKDDWIQRLKLQHTWLWEHCGHFARSFASDELWRDRGHASGDDVIYVLRDVEAAFVDKKSKNSFLKHDDSPDPLLEKTQGLVNLQSVSGVIRPPNMSDVPAAKSIAAANRVLSEERLLQKDKRQVLVASCVSYSRAILTFEDLVGHEEPPATKRGNACNKSSFPGAGSTEFTTNGKNILNLLRQRLVYAFNETGKMFLSTLRSLLSKGKSDEETNMAAEALLDSAQFWFLEGLDTFSACRDIRNLALLRCNLCQCYKLRANSSFTSQASEGASHAEVCLEEAVNHLQAAHEAMGERDVDPMTWDMVSEELAATFLVLAVRRRQSLLGGGSAPVIFQAMRLIPGKERSITDPMEQALKIYQQSGNLHQAAAVHYQLALTNSKTWTCQRDEAKTREKLSAAFSHFNMAFAFFSSNLRGNEPTFVLLCLDLASLYAAVSGVECLTKALSRCLDTHDAFSQESIDAARPNSEWVDKMNTLAASVDDRVFKLLRDLVKLEPDRYKELYREALTAKMVKNVPEQEECNEKLVNLLSLYDVLNAIRKRFKE